ncbi:MAG: polymer-forming cytoskeletal protein, partial [Ardenticatenia bacterium]|nr:polymer-forming cytoskeletal protein [Ardenticatenia bacterium]
MTFTYRRVLASVTLVLLLLLVLFVASSSAESLSGNQVVIEADQVVEDDLYVAAGDLIIDGTVKGDVLTFAGSVTVNGTIEGDLIAGAQVIIINGLVADDARLGAQAVVLGKDGEIGDDVMVGSFSLETNPGSSIGGDLWLGLYQALLAGEVSGDVLGGGGGIQIDGQVNGNVHIEVGDPSQAPPFSMSLFMPELPAGVTIPNVQPGLTVDEGAAIGGTLSYTSQSEANIASGTVSGPVTHQEPVIEEEEAPPPGVVFATWLLNQVRRLVRLLVVGLLMVWLLPAWLARSSEALRAKPWPSLGWGALSPFGLLVVLVATLIAILAIA